MAGHLPKGMKVSAREAEISPENLACTFPWQHVTVCIREGRHMSELLRALRWR
jgi:hypothetical protein